MKNVIFDLYGTLIDIHTDEQNDMFWNRFAKKTKKYKAYSSKDLKNKYLLLCEEKQKEIEELDIIDVFKELYDTDDIKANEIALIFRKYSTKYIRLYKGVKKLLRRLKKERFNLYVLSNAQEAFTMPELEKLKIKKYFKNIAISSVYGVKKPNIAFYKEAFNRFEIENGIMIGNDIECDILPARQIGLKTIFIKSNLTFDVFIEPDFEGFDYEKIYQKIISYKIG